MCLFFGDVAFRSVSVTPPGTELSIPYSHPLVPAIITTFPTYFLKPFSIIAYDLIIFFLGETRRVELARVDKNCLSPARDNILKLLSD